MKGRLLSILLVLYSYTAYSQCGAGTPAFEVDLSANADAIWQSPSVQRDDNCCGTEFPDRCVKFLITLNSEAVGINFEVIDGALPTGALFYQIGCGPQTPVGEPICLEGPGPHILTFCKPGKNQNIYQLTSIPPAVGGTNVTINDGCTGSISASGFNESTIRWRSVYPGNDGDYDNYLSCASGCAAPTVTAVGGAPAYVDFEVCGVPEALCSFPTICDTVRVTFNPTLFVDILPIEPAICFGQTSTTITAYGRGGTPPYTYLWNNVNPSQSINVGVGNYTVRLTDNSDCPPTYNSVTVTSFSVDITADAGPDQTVCAQGNPVLTLNGTVVGATGGVWSGGQGTYSSDSTELASMFYTPTSAELASGFTNLYLTTTGNGSCPSDVDTVVLNFTQFDALINTTVDSVSCFGGSDGSITLNLNGSAPPYSYDWSVVPSQTTASASGLNASTFSVTITDNIGCTFDTAIVVNEPQPLSVTASIVNVSCSGGSNGSISAIPTGGTPPYSYSWDGGQTSSSISAQPTGTYTVTVTDANACAITGTYSITEPLPLALSLTKANVSCFGGSNGTATSSASGGTSPYSFGWSNGATSPNASGLQLGTYTLTVTDNNACVITDTISVFQPPQIIVSISRTNETCNYLDNGTASAVVTGGTGPFTYNWQPIAQISNSVGSLSSGTYTLTVTDSLACPVVQTVNITEPSPLAINFINVGNVSCLGGSDGSATANVSGGTAAYSYAWTPSTSNTATAGGLAAGTHSLTVTDINGCVLSNTVTITEPALALSATGTSTNVSCNGGEDGTASVTAAGGTPPYMYLWSEGNQTTLSISNLAVGTYSVTVTDLKGCQVVNPYSITEPQPISIVLTENNVSCFGGSNASIASTVSGGTSPYSYSWSTSGATGSAASGLPAGTHTLTVTDNNGCQAIDSAEVTEPTQVFVSATSTDETCYYFDDGTATASAYGGTSPYTYSWSAGGQTTATASGLASGSYIVTTTDSLGCTATTTVVIGEPAPIVISFTGLTDVKCAGGNDGAISAVVTGGRPNYSYLWSPDNQVSNTIFNLAAGTYSLTITDAAGCMGENEVVIDEPSTALAVTANSVAASCFGGSDGSANAIATGGTGAYYFDWSPGGSTTDNAASLEAGTYTVTTTDDNGCTAVSSVSVDEPAQIVLSTSSVNADCGQPNGQTSVSVSGGSAPYTYLWNPTGGTDATATGLYSGAYVVTVTDNLGCTANQNGNVNENSAPIVVITSQENVTCNGGNDGSVTLSVSGGLAPFTYSWSPYGGTDSIATGLVAGRYTAIVEGANGCKALVNTDPDVTEPTLIVPSVITSPVSCYGGTDGSATAQAFGGTPGYTYRWLPSNSTGSSIGGLSASTYSVEVTDLNGCIQTKQFITTQPLAPLTVDVTSDSVSCFGGNDGGVTASAQGGTGPYSYNWTPGNYAGSSISNLPIGTYTVTVVDYKGCTVENTIEVYQPTPISLSTSSVNSTCGFANGQASVIASGGVGNYSYLWIPTQESTQAISGLKAASYSVTVNDGNACSSSASVLVSNEASPTSTVSSITNISCNGGSDGTATVTPSGGLAPYSYLWSPSGNTSSTAIGLAVGTYTVVTTDANGCKSTAVSPRITEPKAISLLINNSDVSCFGGSDGAATVIASGGVGTYTYQWLPGGTSGMSVSGLTAGTYSVEVRDANNCVELDEYFIDEPTQLIATISFVKNVSCYGGSDGATVVVISGGTTAYNYEWTPQGGNGPSAANLSAGTYSLSVLDANSCPVSSTVTITEPAFPLSVVGTAGITSCVGTADATATATPSGGTTPYKYLWSQGSTTQTATGLSDQTYYVTVTDSNSCTAITSVVVTEPQELQGMLMPSPSSCGLANGEIASQVWGGTPPYTYLWSNNSATTQDINAIPEGTYTLQVTDANNCSIQLNATIVNIPSETISLTSSTPVSCKGGSNGAANVTISQTTGAYSIEWFPYGGSALSATSLSAGTYTVVLTDSNACISEVFIPIEEPEEIDVSIITKINVRCYGESSGSMEINATGGNGGYTYSWSPIASTSPTVNNLSAGTYTATITDQKACSKSISSIITEPEILLSTIARADDPACFGLKGKVTAIATGGTVPYTYAWSTNPVSFKNTENVPAGTFTVTVTDKNGCIAKSSTTLIEPAQVVTIASPDDTVCIGESADLIASASGGAGNFYYAWQPTGEINGGAFTITPVGDTTYIVIAYDQNGCPGTSDTVNIKSFSLLTPDNVDVKAISPLCLGQSTVVYAETKGNTGELEYEWNNGLGNSVEANLVTPLEPTTYILTTRSIACGTFVVDSINIEFNPQPTIIMDSDTNELCAPDIIMFMDNSLTGNIQDPITSWYWQFGDGSTSTEKNPSHLFQYPGTYNTVLTVTTDNGCTSNNASAPLSIESHPTPIANFNVNSTVLTIPIDKLEIYNKSIGADYYAWDFGDGNTSDEESPVYMYRTVGNYEIQLIVSTEFTCADTTYLTIKTTSNFVFPNVFTPSIDGPTGGAYDPRSLDNNVFFPFTSGVVEYKLQIFNRWGELIFESFDVEIGWDGYYRGVLSPQDVYIWKAFLKLNNGDEYNETGDVTLLR